jgi:tetratricopeptide (TPR) repeat protein
MRWCPVCGRRYQQAARFCEGCARPDGGAVVLLDTRPVVDHDADAEGLVVGGKAVIGGDVVARQDQHIYQGATQVTHVRTVDETKVTHTCALCGLKGTVSDGFHACPGCGRTVCRQDFVPGARLCVQCRDAAATVREDIYRQHALRYLANGRIVDSWERRRLDEARRSLGLPAVRAADIEQAVKRDLPHEDWRPEDERQLTSARQVLLEQGDAAHAIAYLEALAERHPEHQGLQTVWLEALAEHDPERALRATEAAQADVPAVHIVRARILRDRGAYQDGLDLLRDAHDKPATSAACREELTAAIVELILRQHLATRNPLYLQEARERFAAIAASPEPYPQALAALLRRLHGETVDLARLPVARADSIHARRVARLLRTVAEGATRPTTRVLRSRAKAPHPAQQVALVQEQARADAGPATRTFLPLRPDVIPREPGRSG